MKSPWRDPDRVSGQRKLRPYLILFIPQYHCLHIPVSFLPSMFLAPQLSLSSRTSSLYPSVFYYQLPVILLDIKKYTSTEQLQTIKKNRFSPGRCMSWMVDALKWDEEMRKLHLGEKCWSTTKNSEDHRQISYCVFTPVAHAGTV